MRNYSPVNFTNVRMQGDFWRERLDTVLNRTIESQHAKLVEMGMIESLECTQPPPPLRIARRNDGFTTQIFWDSDIGKWIEAASYALGHGKNERIEAQIDEITDLYAKVQLPDGYLNTWYIGREIDKRWTNLRDNHELYNAGHLLEGAIAYFQATGKRKLLDVMEKYVDHIAATFGTGPGQKRGYPGHEEIELALVKLYYVTKAQKHLDLVVYFINQRGAQPHYFDEEAIARGDDPKKYWAGTYEYSQAHIPVREQTKVVGHAVRAFYLYTAMADIAAEINDPALKKACELLWDDVMSKRMYVTAGFGPSAHNEGFTTDYDLPNDTAYAETCATVAMVFWAQRMLNLDLDGKYGDALELGLFNSGLSGLSLEGTHYFYENKLESDGTHQRWAWHNCPCCTMNVSRLVASIGGYFYSTGKDLIAVHLYGGTSATIDLGGKKVVLTEKSDFPWSGKVDISIDPEQSSEFTLKLRIPAWADGTKVAVNGTAIDIATNTDKGYLAIKRTWAKGDSVTMDLPMQVRRLYAHPKVRMDVGRVALSRGPLVYCVEQTDNPGALVSELKLPRTAEIHVEERKELLGGIKVLTANAIALTEGDWGGDTLYRTAPPTEKPASMTAIPYYIWNNRGPSRMQVWINEQQ
ncbi:beta-L-arabinofuranosidase domain-containing protein [Devosia sp.]|uniref:glycoside hydrolase family 127 protein n=1 Tax=Devosia sp. TaxID=1871048 RepID=UPI0032638AD4